MGRYPRMLFFWYCFLQRVRPNLDTFQRTNFHFLSISGMLIWETTKQCFKIATFKGKNNEIVGINCKSSLSTRYHCLLLQLFVFVSAKNLLFYCIMRSSPYFLHVCITKSELGPWTWVEAKLNFTCRHRHALIVYTENDYTELYFMVWRRLDWCFWTLNSKKCCLYEDWNCYEFKVRSIWINLHLSVK